MKKTFFAVLILFAGVVHASPLSTTPQLCEAKQIKSIRNQGCRTEDFFYKNEDGKQTAGKLVTLDLGMVSHGDYATPGTRYFLYEYDKNSLLDLGEFPQKAENFMVSCLMRKFMQDADMAYTGGTARYKPQFFSYPSYEMKDDKLYAVHKGRFPFQGEVKTLDGRSCEGNFGFAPNVLTWLEAREMCKQHFKAETGQPEREYENRPAVEMNSDLAGSYYLCSQFYVSQNGEYEDWFYRIDMDSRYKTPILLKKLPREPNKQIQPSPPPKFTE